MLSILILPWLHYLSALMMTGAAVAELYLLRLPPEPHVIRLLPRVDRFYALTALLLLATGVARFYHGGKGADWYWHNGLVHLLLGVFVASALYSLWPTRRFLRWRRALDERGELPAAAQLRRASYELHIPLVAISVMVLLITAIARGYGHTG